MSDLTPTTPIPVPVLRAVQVLQQGRAIANRAVVADIEEECYPVQLPDGLRWHDTRPMIDPREHCPQVTDMAAQALAFAEVSGLVIRHPEQRHLVRIVRPA